MSRGGRAGPNTAADSRSGHSGHSGVQDPTTKPSKGAMAWVTTSVLVMVVAAVLLRKAGN
ncbi:hypothetical protein ABZ553_18330 [Streptomyces sparsogenes]|uniref:hypothetical protein n=1 Tax=Streptomyces sparsogenes TaxID=67365 RepID=UPI0033E60B16